MRAFQDLREFPGVLEQEKQLLRIDDPVTLESDPGTVLSAARRLLADGHGLPHFTVQVEPPGAHTHCTELTW